MIVYAGAVMVLFVFVIMLLNLKEEELGHERLTAWKVSYDLLLAIYRTTEVFPRQELYGLTSQTRRAAFSVVANIAGRVGSAKAHALLTEAALDSGLTPSETKRQIDSGLTHARRQREGGGIPELATQVSPQGDVTVVTAEPCRGARPIARR